MAQQKTTEELVLQIQALAGSYKAIRETKKPLLNQVKDDNSLDPQAAAKNKAALQAALQTLQLAYNFLTTNAQKS